MKICKRCLYPSNHPFGLTFIGDICSGCYVHEEKYKIDWNKRYSDLIDIVKNVKRKSHTGYDCIVPITGSGDTYFTIDFIKNRLGLNPLLVHYNNHFNTPLGIRNISNIANSFNCDLVSNIPSPSALKKVSLTTLKHNGNFYWQAIAGYLTFPVQTAVKYNIPLIFWGVNGWLDQVGMYSHLDSVQMTKRNREEHGLQGISPNDLLKINSEIKPSDLTSFLYPSNSKIANLNLKGIYLNNYIFWDSKLQHEEMIKKYKYETRKMERTFNYYEDVGCMFSSGSNDYLRYFKHGFSKVSDHAARDIRLKRLSVETARKLIIDLSSKTPSDIDLLADWLDLSKQDLIKIFNKNKNLNYFKNDSFESEYIKSLKKINFDDLKEFKLIKADKDINYKLTVNREDLEDKELIMIGRGYNDKYNYGAIEDMPDGPGYLI